VGVAIYQGPFPENDSRKKFGLFVGKSAADYTTPQILITKLFIASTTRLGFES
jgi:hypothetical protein